MKVFSGVQADILKANKKYQLVSAGAGSGKTTVMIEKIANLLINQNVEPENLLVATFTVLAAREMKERLVSKLKEEVQISEDKERILRIIEQIDTANIDTIDGFNSKTIKKFFYDLNISPNIEIISDATRDYYLTKAMKKTFNETSNEDVHIMIDLFGGNRRNLDSIQELILSNYYHIINIENYEEFLTNCMDEYADSIKSEKIVNDYICEVSRKIIGYIIEEYSLFSSSVKEKLSLIVEELKQFNKSISFKTNLKNLNALQSVKFSVSEYRENEGLKLLNSKISEIFKLKEELEKNNINEKYEENNEKILKYLQIFINLLKKFIKNYNKIKENNNLIDFNDLNRLMIKLLDNEKIRKELQQKYKYIFLDEYQDVNPLQDNLMNKLTGEDTTVFMVGDVKQSIYGFRGSSPEWFLDKYNKMKNNIQNEDVFDMNINFRSSPTILQFINQVFNKLMTKEIADIDYQRDCEIEPKREDIIDDKVKIMLIEEDREDTFVSGVYSVKDHKNTKNLKAKDKEALHVAKIITELVGTEFYDANKKEKRKLTYSDIAILTHSDKDENSTILIDVLKNNAIPLNINNKLESNKSESIKLILSILKCVVQTADDVDYLATFLSLTDLEIDDIIKIRDKNFNFYENLKKYIENSEKNEIFDKISDGFEILNDILTASYGMTNREIISYILNEKKLKYYLLEKPNGEKELNLLEEFLSKLSPIEDSLGLAEFVDVIESNVDSSGDFATIDKEDSVTLQTIHKSKGLEYPVVILFNSSKMFSYLREHDTISFNSDVGFGVDYYDTANRIKTESLTKFAIGLLNNQKGYKEELRLLYVALTRAKNKLFITGTISKKDFSDVNKTSYTNMLLSCFADEITEDGLEKENFKLEFVDDVDCLESSNVQDCAFEIANVDFEYPNKNKFNISFKNSVTGINSAQNQQKGYSVKNIVKRTSQYDVENSAAIGTNYHMALELLDITKEYEKNSDFESVDYSKIKTAHEKLYPLAKDAINIKKEAEFMMYVPYNEVVDGEIEDKILIQGVVDLIIEKQNSVILVDYKFSHLPAKVLKEKYFEQLKLYKLAIEKAFNKPVEHMFIYSINTSELI